MTVKHVLVVWNGMVVVATIACKHIKAQEDKNGVVRVYLELYLGCVPDSDRRSFLAPVVGGTQVLLTA